MSDNNYTKGIPISLTINEKDLKEFKEIVDKIEKGQEADLERLKEIVKTGGTEGTATSATTTSATAKIMIAFLVNFTFCLLYFLAIDKTPLINIRLIYCII